LNPEQQELEAVLRENPNVNRIEHEHTAQDWTTECEIGLRRVVFTRVGREVFAQYALNLDGHHRIQIVQPHGRSLVAFARWVLERLSGPYAHLIPSPSHDV